MLRESIMLGVVLVGLVWTGGAAGQEAAEPKEAPAVGWADGEAAFTWVQGWLRSDDGVPGDADLPDRAVTGLFGVYVTLRDEGRVLGRGQALRADLKDAIDDHGPPIQLALLLSAATRQALKELKDKQTKRAIELNIADPELLKIAILEARKRVQLDIQIGHSLESITVPVNAPNGAVFSTFAPGFHGLRLAGPLAGKADIAWPAIELSRNNAAPRTVFRLMDLQGFNADELPIVARADGPALQRFEVIHMVRPGAAQPVRELIRGNVILQQQVIDNRTIAGLAERVARHLDQLITTDARNGNEMVRGTYQPSLQRYAPKWADDRETALLGYALTRHATVALDAGLGGEAMQARAKRVLRLVDQIAPKAIPQNLPPKHLTAALLLLTLCETPARLAPDQLVTRDRLGKALLELVHPEGGGFRVEKNSDKTLSRASAAVCTAALAAYYKDTRSKSLPGPVWQVLTDLMKANANQDDARDVDLLWVAYALDRAGPDLAKAQPKPEDAAKTLAQWRKTLANYLELLTEQQVRSKPILGPKDVTGGFILEKPIPGSPPEPTWRSAIPTTLLAFALRDPGIIPDDQQFGPVLAAGLGARFLGQLIVTPPSAYYLRDSEPALGGVRRTLWDNTLYPDISSTTLIALAELQQTLIQLEPED
ncbi:MAG: hypothetical protein KTR15_09865 [Phycisphaeraceae bacterium]|nr:hypothetical protein [Phycisphaeraceae bacterium]